MMNAARVKRQCVCEREECGRERERETKRDERASCVFVPFSIKSFLVEEFFNKTLFLTTKKEFLRKIF